MPIDQPLFQPYPSEVVFHSYEPFKTYETTLRLRNNDTVSVQLQQQQTALNPAVTSSILVQP